MNNSWQHSLSSSYEQLISYLVAYVPQLFGAILLIFIGWIIAWLLSKMTTSLVEFVSNFLNKIIASFLPDKTVDIQPKHARIAGKTVFWVVMLFFFAAATSSLGMEFIATWLKEFLSYLPQILAGAIIILAGYFLGSIAYTMTVAAAETTGFEHSHRLGALVKWIVIFIAIVIGIEQLGINIQFVTTLIIVQLGVLSLGFALAYGLGSSELIKNLVGAKQANKHFQVGDRIKIGEIEGKLMEISSSMIIVETDKGKTLIPARSCMEKISKVIERDGGDDNAPISH
ncbi:mechanosensitive ion channel family protein [Flocculibacter collagenilyticus]|uniref:mechanosensitive ion channel family protein n=1 Tax=Flocculibacter collagenilyticus TaxID=2744479 RepID=UPI0018F6A518|nr:mechanosensitive ion channel domain-containing protein [Flocculibacter collagenilyticus]